LKPLLLDNCTQRIGNFEKKYSYDRDLNLNVISINNSKRPFIALKEEDLELITITHVKREEDDESFGCTELQMRETRSIYFGLETKSFTQVETEEEDNKCLMMELLTKTAVGRETDDDDFNSY